MRRLFDLCDLHGITLSAACSRERLSVNLLEACLLSSDGQENLLQLNKPELCSKVGSQGGPDYLAAVAEPT